MTVRKTTSHSQAIKSGMLGYIPIHFADVQAHQEQTTSARPRTFGEVMRDQHVLSLFQKYRVYYYTMHSEKDFVIMINKDGQETHGTLKYSPNREAIGEVIKSGLPDHWIILDWVLRYRAEQVYGKETVCQPATSCIES